MFRAEFFSAEAAESVQSRRVAVKKTFLIQQHHAIGGRIEEGSEFRFRAPERLALPAQQRLHLLALRDVAEKDGNPSGIARKGVEAHLYIDQVPILAAMPALEPGGTGLLDSFDIRCDLTGGLIGLDVGDRLFQQFLARVAEHATGGFIHIQDAALRVHQPEPIQAGAKDGRLFLVILSQTGFDPVSGQRHLDDGAQVPLMERFENVAERIALLGAFEHRFVGRVRQKDHRKVETVVDELRGGDAIHFPLESNVHEYQIGAQLPGQSHTFLSQRSVRQRLVTQLGQLLMEITGTCWIECNDENSGLGGSHGATVA